jgi:hypothetical protein
VAKHRSDVADQLIGPFAHDFRRGRMTTTSPLAAAFATTSPTTWPEQAQLEYAMSSLGGPMPFNSGGSVF